MDGIHHKTYRCAVCMLILPAFCFAGFEADLNGDQYVGIEDLAIIAYHWLNQNISGCSGDTDLDCQINMNDIAKLSEQWQWMQCISTASASSQESSLFLASNAIDGDMGTRWSSSFNDNQWLEIDLGRTRHFYGLTIHWESAYASVYTIEVSSDAADWMTVYTELNGDGGTDECLFPEQSKRYIRINCVTRSSQWGSSIYEVTVRSDDVCVESVPGWKLVWSDEFEGPNLNAANWVYEIGTGSNGWGNWEWQYYTGRTENCRIEDGILILEARKENYNGKNYTSARIKTQNKQSFQYGRIEARIKMPVGGEGIWPAFWMLGHNIPSAGWPACGEIDIVELMRDPTTAIGAIHYGSSSPYVHQSNSGNDKTVGNMSSGFHIYAIEWEPTQIRWYRDDYNYYTSSTWWSGTGSYPAPFNQPFFILLNFAVGASWWDKAITDSVVPFPQQFNVDYVRVYQMEP